MADFPGVIESFGLRAIPANLSVSLANGAEESMLFPLSVTRSPIFGSSAGASSVATAHTTGIAGFLQLLFGANLFERISFCLA